MMRACLLALALLAPGAASAADARIRTVTYDPDAVVRVEGRFSTAVQIVLAEGEEILHVALGDSAAWEAAPEGRLLFLKPLAAKPTNLILATRAPNGSTRSYAFELRMAKGPGPWTIRFSYPQDQKAKAAALIDAHEIALQRKLQQLRLDRGAVEGPRNLNWSLQGAASLQPSEVTDNGLFTVIRFPGGQSIPAVFAVAEDGAESLTPYDVRGEFLVIHGVHRQLRLREGGQVLCLWNDAYDPRAGGAASGTATPQVQRTDEEAR